MRERGRAEKDRGVNENKARRTRRMKVKRGDKHLRLLVSMAWVMGDNELQSDKVTPREMGNNELEDVYKVI